MADLSELVRGKPATELAKEYIKSYLGLDPAVHELQSLAFSDPSWTPDETLTRVILDYRRRDLARTHRAAGPMQSRTRRTRRAA